MKVDRFTKLLLLIISLILGIILLKPAFNPETAIGGGESYDYIKPLGDVSLSFGNGLPSKGSVLLDTRTGDLFWYNWETLNVKPIGNIGKLGGPIHRK